MKTQKQLLTEHRAKLDEQFRIKYPDGKFCLQYRNDGLATYYGEPFWLMHWCPKRATSHVRKRGISIEYRKKVIEHANYQNNSFGKCRNYDSLMDLLTACKKYNCPLELINAFELRFNNRKNEGFNI